MKAKLHAQEKAVHEVCLSPFPFIRLRFDGKGHARERDQREMEMPHVGNYGK